MDIPLYYYYPDYVHGHQQHTISPRPFVIYPIKLLHIFMAGLAITIWHPLYALMWNMLKSVEIFLIFPMHAIYVHPHIQQYMTTEACIAMSQFKGSDAMNYRQQKYAAIYWKKAHMDMSSETESL